jgi:hypothetical protein
MKEAIAKNSKKSIVVCKKKCSSILFIKCDALLCDSTKMKMGSDK